MPDLWKYFPRLRAEVARSKVDFHKIREAADATFKRR